MARPLANIDPEQVRLLAGVGCPVEEIAFHLGCDKRTLERRFAALIEKGRADIRSSLRRKQVELAMKGDRTMLVWLGKQLLGQRDNMDSNVGINGTITHRDADEEAILAAADEIRCRLNRLPDHTG